MLRKFLFSSAALLAFAPLALAAPPAPVAPAPAFNWSGFYVGVYGGYATGRTVATDAGDEYGMPWYILEHKFSFTADSPTFGAQAGYNFQIGNIVLGPEVDAGYLGLRGSALYGAGYTDTFVKGRSTYDVTARARIGYAFDRALVYVTGGAVIADPGGQVIALGGFQTPSVGAQTGWAVGGGVEYALSPAWSLKGEYLHYDLGGRTVAFFQGSSFKIDNSDDIFRVGLNFRFGGL
jgi:outer membrane immunogenic protein